MADRGDLTYRVGEFFQAREDTHGFSGIVTGAEKVDHVALGARARILLQYDDVPAEDVQTLAEGEAGDTGPRR